jgi:hypothetical protein
MSAITKTVTVADVWANDDGGVSLEVEGTIVPLSIVEAATYAVAVMDAAIEAAAGTDADAEQTIREMRERMAVLPEPAYETTVIADALGRPIKTIYASSLGPEPDSWGGRL